MIKTAVYFESKAKPKLIPHKYHQNFFWVKIILVKKKKESTQKKIIGVSGVGMMAPKEKINIQFKSKDE